MCRISLEYGLYFDPVGAVVWPLYPQKWVLLMFSITQMAIKIDHSQNGLEYMPVQILTIVVLLSISNALKYMNNVSCIIWHLISLNAQGLKYQFSTNLLDSIRKQWNFLLMIMMMMIIIMMIMIIIMIILSSLSSSLSSSSSLSFNLQTQSLVSHLAHFCIQKESNVFLNINFPV